MARPEDEQAICARIKQARKESGLSQPELADLLHVTLRAVQNYEHDRVPWRLLKQIAKATGKTQEWLLRGDVQDVDQLDRVEAQLAAVEGKLNRLLDLLGATQIEEAVEQAGQVSRMPTAGSQRTPAAKPKQSRRAS